jgi:hypothetical protein
MGGGIFSEEELPHMLRKTYGSLPRIQAMPRCRVRCALSIESKSIQVARDFLGETFNPGRLAEATTKLLEQSLDDVPAFAKALQEFSARHLLETIAEGVLQLAMGEIEGFSVCPLVTSSIRCLSKSRVDAEVEVNFSAAILTYFTELESAAAKSHDGHLGLYRTYYRDILLKFVSRRLEELLDPGPIGRPESLEAHVTETLGRVLTELRSRFPLEPYQEKYEQADVGPDLKAGIVRKLCQAMRADAKRRLGI